MNSRDINVANSKMCHFNPWHRYPTRTKKRPPPRETLQNKGFWKLPFRKSKSCCKILGKPHHHKTFVFKGFIKGPGGRVLFCEVEKPLKIRLLGQKSVFLVRKRLHSSAKWPIGVTDWNGTFCRNGSGWNFTQRKIFSNGGQKRHLNRPTGLKKALKTHFEIFDGGSAPDHQKTSGGNLT